MEGRPAEIAGIGVGAHSRRPIWRRVGLVLLGIAAAALSVALIVQNAQLSATESVITSALAVVVGGSYVASGLVAWEQVRDGPVGPLMVFIGFAWFATFL